MLEFYDILCVDVWNSMIFFAVMKWMTSDTKIWFPQIHHYCNGQPHPSCQMLNCRKLSGKSYFLFFKLTQPFIVLKSMSKSLRKPRHGRIILSRKHKSTLGIVGAACSTLESCAVKPRTITRSNDYIKWKMCGNLFIPHISVENWRPRSFFFQFNV